MTVYLRFLSCLARRFCSFLWILRVAASFGSLIRSRLRASLRVARNTARRFCTNVYESRNSVAPILASSSSSTSCASSEASDGLCCSLIVDAARYSGLSICITYLDTNAASCWRMSAAKSLKIVMRTVALAAVPRDRYENRVSSHPMGVAALARASCWFCSTVIVVSSGAFASSSDSLPAPFAASLSSSSSAASSAMTSSVSAATYCGMLANTSSACSRNASAVSACSAISSVNAGFSKSLAMPAASANSLPGCFRYSLPSTPLLSRLIVCDCANCNVAALRRPKYDVTNLSAARRTHACGYSSSGSTTSSTNAASPEAALESASHDSKRPVRCAPYLVMHVSTWNVTCQSMLVLDSLVSSSSSTSSSSRAAMRVRSAFAAFLNTSSADLSRNSGRVSSTSAVTWAAVHSNLLFCCRCCSDCAADGDGVAHHLVSSSTLSFSCWLPMRLISVLITSAASARHAGASSLATRSTSGRKKNCARSFSRSIGSFRSSVASVSSTALRPLSYTKLRLLTRNVRWCVTRLGPSGYSSRNVR
uniref:Uncharacterized protein n=1 Tax=Globisporangium ultimum (strain ATCC 200006 / CBS 805.95 / DAOM BR144) TaxID=431595 RepID=K3WHG2_GLOUD